MVAPNSESTVTECFFFTKWKKKKKIGPKDQTKPLQDDWSYGLSLKGRPHFVTAPPLTASAYRSTADPESIDWFDRLLDSSFGKVTNV